MTDTKPDLCEIAENELPWVYLVANQAAGQAQKHFLRLISIDVFLLLLATLISVYPVPGTTGKTIVIYLRALLLIGSLFLSLVLQRQHPEREWYDTRWLAETVLTEAWLYMTCTKPYASDPKQTDNADEKFIAAQQVYLDQHQSVARLLAGEFSDKSMTSPTMKEIRCLAVDERRKLYVKCRLKNQRGWYGTKANKNKSAEDKWYWAIITAQICAVAYAMVLIPATLSTQWIANLNLTGLFVAVASASLAWMQLKQFRQLAQSYGAVEQKLRQQENKSQ